LYFEKFYFTLGDLGFGSVATPFGKLGILICWDQWYPEGARIAALSGADLLVYPTAIGWHPSEKAEYGPAQLDAWRTIQRSHAIAASMPTHPFCSDGSTNSEMAHAGRMGAARGYLAGLAA